MAVRIIAADRGRPLDDTARRLLRDLGRSLAEAIAGSGDAGATLRRLREEGYSLYLLLDRNERAKDKESEEVEAPIAPPAAGTSAVVRRGREPAFRINASDLFFLRSIGIDPTRRGR